jgi:cytidyltransferase-like protein
MKTFLEYFIGEEDEQNNKTVVFAYGRFNPPSIGHLKLIEQVISTAKKYKADYYIVPSQSTAKPTPKQVQTNPLSLQQRIAILKHMVPNSDSVADFGTTFINALKKFQEMGYTQAIQIAGSDREEEFMRLVNKYNGKADSSGEAPFTFKEYKFVSAGQRDPDSEGVEGMSASKLRKFAVDGNYQEFESGMAPSVPEELKKEAYNQVRKAFNVE